jgi:SPP1 gp7 family putative phage head morphogenesis protein
MSSPAFTEQVRRRRRLMKTTLGRTLPKRVHLSAQVFPKTIEGSYLRGIQQLLEAVHRLVLTTLVPMLVELTRTSKELRGDAAPEDARKQLQLIRISAQGVFLDERVSDLAKQMADRTKDYQHGQLERQLKAAVGVDIPVRDPQYQERLNAFTAENVALIQSIPSTYLDQVQARVMSGITAGERAEDLADDIEDRFAVSESRAALIARDQIGKFYGALNRATQRELGIDSFVWETMQDERVRPEHADLNGKTFTWEKGAPVEGFPGEPISCRCTASPDVSGLLADLESD